MQPIPYTIDTPTGPKIVHMMRYPDREIWIMYDEIKRGVLRRVEAQHVLHEGSRKSADGATIWLPMTNAVAKMLDAQYAIFPPGNIFVHWKRANGPAGMAGIEITAALFSPMVENMLDRMYANHPLDLTRYGSGNAVARNNETELARYIAELPTN